jgi:ATP-dependent DNA ligase
MVYEIIKDLEAESSTNAKLDILKANSDNRILRQFFLMALNPHMTFGIKKIPDISDLGYDSTPSFLGEVMQGLYQLANREITGNAAIDYLRQILNSCTPEHADLICRIITKDPGCGVGYKLVNKVWKKLIPVTPYMRCASANDKNYARIKYPAFCQKKANGVFLNLIIRNEQVEVQSRNGKVLELHGMLDGALLSLLKVDHPDAMRHFVIHGEGLVLKEGRKIDDEDAYLDRKTGNGIINKAVQGTISLEEARRIVVECWDIVDYNEWVEGKSDVVYEMRYDYLWHTIVNSVNRKLSVIETRMVDSFKDAAKYYNELLQRGEEGAVLKNRLGIWKNHTSPNQVKMKVKDPADLLCVGVQPHKKKEGWIGALILESADGIIKVKTGTGLKEVDRQKDPSEYIGKIIEVEYNEITDDKSTGQKSLFLPVYVDTREDKDEADDFRTILERSTVPYDGK